MAIEVNDIAGLKNRNKGVGKLTLSDSDYILRTKNPEDAAKNTFDISKNNNKYQEELTRLKAEARKSVESELLSSDFMDKLKAEIRAEMKNEVTPTTKVVTKTGAK